MDRNTLNEILKILPDDFGFKAVYEEPENEALKDSQVLILGIGKHKIEFTNGKYRPKNIKSWREKVGEEMFDKAFIKRVWQRK